MATAILSDLYGPEFRLHPYLGRAGTASLTAVTGLIKPFLLPLISALGVLLMPILAAIKMERGDVEGTKAYLQSWGVSFLTLSASIAFIAAIGYTLPLLWSSVCMAALCALSIICHVAKSIQ